MKKVLMLGVFITIAFLLDVSMAIENLDFEDIEDEGLLTEGAKNLLMFIGWILSLISLASFVALAIYRQKQREELIKSYKEVKEDIDKILEERYKAEVNREAIDAYHESLRLEADIKQLEDEINNLLNEEVNKDV